jgi:hypothetical protein
LKKQKYSCKESYVVVNVWSDGFKRHLGATCLRPSLVGHVIVEGSLVVLLLG